MNQLTEDDLSMMSWMWLGTGTFICIITIAFPDLINACWVEPTLALCAGFSFVWVGLFAEITRMVTPWEE